MAKHRTEIPYQIMFAGVVAIVMMLVYLHSNNNPSVVRITPPNYQAQQIVQNTAAYTNSQGKILAGR